MTLASQEEKEVVDKPGAKDLVITDGVIEFRDVHFGYSEELEAISGISFKIEKGESVALVSDIADIWLYSADHVGRSERVARARARCSACSTASTTFAAARFLSTARTYET